MKDEAMVAKELLKLAKELSADEFTDEEAANMEEDNDPKFAEKVRTLRQMMPVISRKKAKRLRQYGIALIRPNDTVETLIDALLKIAQS
jgi:hypothetical protein